LWKPSIIDRQVAFIGKPGATEGEAVGEGFFLLVPVTVVVTVGDEVAVVVFVDVGSNVAVGDEVVDRVWLEENGVFPVRKVQQTDNPIMDPRNNFVILTILPPSVFL
jgi:hypothetical protein